MSKRFKEIVTLVVLIVVSLSASAGIAQAFQNEPEGFRGLKWGDPPREEMIKIPIIGIAFLDYYRLPNDKLALGRIPLYRITYQFFSKSEEDTGRFSSVALYFRTTQNHETLKTICRNKFGHETIKDFESIEWLGPIALITLKYDMIKEKGALIISSTELTSEYVEAVEQLEIEMAKDDW